MCRRRAGLLVVAWQSRGRRIDSPIPVWFDNLSCGFFDRAMVNSIADSFPQERPEWLFVSIRLMKHRKVRFI